MENIKELINQQFALFNLTEEKRPCLSKWQTLSAEELKAHHNFNNTRWGLRMGLQDNGRRIMSIDFDCCGEPDSITRQRNGCEFIKQYR